MREISPSVNLSCEEFYKTLLPQSQAIVDRIRSGKNTGNRPKPSTCLIDKSSLLTEKFRRGLLDAVAGLVDENLSGRSDMCEQFAILVSQALEHMGLSSRVASGTAIYYNAKGRELFKWKHAWVRVGKEVIDGNVDCLFENPMVPPTVNIFPYWGPIAETPTDRNLRENRNRTAPPDSDVSEIWWPELQEWLKTILIFYKEKHL